jgi:hypothetical protein
MVPKIEDTLDVSTPDAPTAFHPRSKSKLQPSIKALCDLIDIVSQNETHIPILLTKTEYQELAARLDDLLDIVGEENHSLAPLLHFVGTLIKNYEDEYVPRLTEF